MQVLFAILLAALGIAQAQMSFPDITQAAAAIDRVFRTIDRKTQIDSGSEAGQGFCKPHLKLSYTYVFARRNMCVSCHHPHGPQHLHETDMWRLLQQCSAV